ncbi:transposase [Nitrosomonas sp. HPC101]|nr:transposase [Nitrosomonas sp. HPC101]
MSNYRRVRAGGGVYFFTLVTRHRQKILCHENIRQALRAGIETTRLARPFVIHGWVLLPDHLHCIWALPPDDADFSVRWSMIKRFVTQQCGLQSSTGQRKNESSLWQRRFWEHQIRNERDYRRHMDYLHYNPVKHGLVTKVSDWPYSTFHRHVRLGTYEPDWAGTTPEPEPATTGEP